VRYRTERISHAGIGLVPGIGASVMTEADELREHAARCGRLANSATDRNVARVLMDLAEEYLAKAERLERGASAPPKTPVAAPEQQPVQQQQQIQSKKEEKE
jgi:hypothetical protein